MSTNRRIPLIHKQTIVGRNTNLLLNINDISVSTKHAIIEYNNDFTKLYIIDQGAKNGIYINQQLVEPLGKKRMHHGDKVTFGNSKIQFKIICSKHENAEGKCSDSDEEVD